MIDRKASYQYYVDEVDEGIAERLGVDQLIEDFSLRLVLTAHPTQFYPANVLGIIHDMGEAIGKNDFNTINQYIQQLGLTPFFNKKQPTPTDEALTLMWYLENIFYQTNHTS